MDADQTQILKIQHSTFKVQRSKFNVRSTFLASLSEQSRTVYHTMIHSISHIRVRYAETDRMDVVHHRNYLVWFEAARIHMLDEIGIPYRELEASGFYIPVLSASLEYKRPAFFDDHLEVHLFMREKPRVRFHVDYEVRREDTLLATGTTSLGFVDKNAKVLRPPEDFIRKINAAWKPLENIERRTLNVEL